MKFCIKRYLFFSNEIAKWFESYLSNRKFTVEVKNKYSQLATVSCGVPQGSILGPLLFLLYINDMPQAVDCDLLLYADDSCIFFQHKDLKVIEERLNKNFSSICDWFVDNKLSVHFGDEKTKSILFTPKNKVNKIGNLNIKYSNIDIKQHRSVAYLGCTLDETLSGESMVLNVIHKITTRLKFLYRKNDFLNQSLRRLLCNALIQPHFDYACSAWYPFLSKKYKTRLQTLQNKCMRFCLHLDSRAHIGYREFKEMKWLPVNDRFHQCIGTAAFKFLKGKSPAYMDDLFTRSESLGVSIRSSFMRLNQPSRNTTYGQNNLSYLSPITWNPLPRDLKSTENLNSYKHKIKDHFFEKIRRRDENIYLYL